MLRKSEYIKFKNAAELFKLHEKDTFRLWVWGFFAGLLVLNILFIINLVVTIIYKEDIITTFTKAINDAAKNGVVLPADQVQEGAIKGYNAVALAPAIVQPCFSLIMTFLYVSSVHQSYKEKDFRFISKFPNFLIGVLLFLTAVSYIYGFISLNVGTVFSKFSALGIVTFIMLAIVWAIFGREVNYIRQSFQLIFFREETKRQQEILSKQLGIDPNQDIFSFLSQVSQQQRQNNGYPKGPGPGSNTSHNPYGVPNGYAAGDDANVQPVFEEDPKTKKINELIDMPEVQLFKIAEKLKIYGYKEMGRRELAEKIYYITNPDKR